MKRRNKIKKIIELHNTFLKIWAKYHPRDKMFDIWNIEDVDMNYDKYYLVENIDIKFYDEKIDKKIFEPATSVKLHLRSADRIKFGYKKNYRETISIKNKYIKNPKNFFIKIESELKPQNKK